MPMTPLCLSVVRSTDDKVIVTEPLNQLLGKVSKWCDLWG